MGAEPRFCSNRSRARGEALLGTASTVVRWILVEQSGPWGRDALRESRLSETHSERLRTLVRSMGARGLLIRRHGRYEQEGHRVMVAFTGRKLRWLEELWFEDMDAVLSHDYSPLKRGRSVGGKRLRDLRLFVCTHGKHDPCCAREGRRVAEALHHQMPDATWESSHIGGDRFAGNMLVLPLGVYYGRVEPDRAPGLVRRLRQGELDLTHFRGRTCFSFSAQAAESLARERLGLTGIDDLELLEHEEVEPKRFRTTFRVEGEDEVTVDVEVGRGPEACLTCHASEPAAPPEYRLVRLR